MSETLWQELGTTPDGNGTVRRRLHPDADHDLYIQVAHPSATRQAVLVLKGQHTEPRLGALRSSRGVSVNVEHLGQGRHSVVLGEVHRQYGRVFEVVAHDVLNAAALMPAGPDVVDRVLQQVRTWQRCLEAVADSGLSQEGQLGLYGELTALTRHVLPAAGAEGLSYWQGPAGAPQDFQTPAVALEVKATRVHDPRSFAVHGLRQLDSSPAPLMLLHLSVDARPHNQTGQTLQQAVDAARAQIVNLHGDEDMYETALLQAGYLADHAPRYTSRYSIMASTLFDISPGFPRLTRATVPPGITDVQYSVDLSACLPFEVPTEQLTAALTPR